MADEIKEKYACGEAQAREAFDELCGMYEAIEVCTIVISSSIDLCVKKETTFRVGHFTTISGHFFAN